MKYIRMLRVHMVRWLPFVWVSTLFFGFTYVALQQTLRSNANQSSIEVVESAASQLMDGKQLIDVTGAANEDLALTQKTFLVIFDDHFKPIASNVKLNGSLPNFPAGALVYTLSHDDNRVTWQPIASLRFATVARRARYHNRTVFIVAGHSLKETENQAGMLLAILGCGWLVTLISSLGLLIVLHTKSK